MKKTTMLKIVNPLLGLLLLNQVLMGVLHGVVPKDIFEFFHEGGGVILTLVAILHILLNWNWVKANFLRKAPKPQT